MLRKNGFRLQPVLDYTSSVVNSLEVEFAQLKLTHKNEIALLQRLEEAKHAEMNELHNQQQGVLDCDSILLRQQYLEALDTQITRQHIRAQTAEEKANAKRNELVDSMKEQKTLEKLKDNHSLTQRLNLQRKEARIVDDMVTARYGRER